MELFYTIGFVVHIKALSFVQHPHVQECCVLGVEDKDYGEIVCAIIVLDVEAKKKAEKESRPALTLEQLCSWAGSKLAPYKVNFTNSHLSLSSSFSKIIFKLSPKQIPFSLISSYRLDCFCGINYLVMPWER